MNHKKVVVQQRAFIILMIAVSNRSALRENERR